jgi:hypothetical protein
MDKVSEKVTPKNCYANPSRPYISLFLALGCYLSIYQNKFKQDSDKLLKILRTKLDEGIH